jgi:hypothetical protein
MEEIKKITTKKDIIEYVVKCEFCGKEIRGSTEGQVSFNLLTHKKGKVCKHE